MSSKLQLDACCLSCCGGATWRTLTKERQAWCYLQVKLCDLCLSALYVPWREKALYKYSSFPFLYDGDNTDMFLNQLDQFYSNNATNLHHLTSHSRLRRVAPQHGDRNMTTDYCDVTSPYANHGFPGNGTRKQTVIFRPRSSDDKILSRDSISLVLLDGKCTISCAFVDRFARGQFLRSARGSGPGELRHSYVIRSPAF